MPGDLPKIRAPLAVVAACLCAATCVAQGGLVRAEDAASNRGKVLVLTNGRIVEGRITQSGGGYVVDLPTGSMLVPYGQVRLEAPNRAEAYKKLRETMPQRTATNHLALARWCITHQLHSQAKAELSDALHLEPDREDARAMLKRLDTLIRPAAPVRRTEATSKPRADDGFEARPVKSLAGLPRATAAEFVNRVQPLLSNNCGNASCHGGSAGGSFRLDPVPAGRRGSHRLLAERNLAAVLNWVDPKHPGRSPLLSVPQNGHGRHGRSVFDGPAGGTQYEILKRWVVSAAEFGTATSGRSGSGSTITARADRSEVSLFPRELLRSRVPASPPASASEAETDPPAESRPEATGHRDDTTPLREPRPNDPDDALLERILREERFDAFDPELFNRQFRGGDG